MEAQKKQKQFMQRNVTDFRHLIKEGFSTENQLNWAITLRQHAKIPKGTGTKSEPFQVFYKDTQVNEHKSKGKENSAKIRSQDYPHMIAHSQPSEHQEASVQKEPKQTAEQMGYYSTLRQINSKSMAQLGRAQKSFDVTPFKQRQQQPTFLKSSSMKKTNGIKKDDQEPALDGAHRQQPYSLKILKVKNYAVLSKLTKSRGRGQVSLPTLAWQMGLRGQ